MKLYFLLITFFYLNTATSQTGDTIYCKSNLPIKGGYILRFNDVNFSYKKFKEPISGVFIFSNQNTDSLYSLSDGIVHSIVKTDSEKICIIKVGSMFYSYGNLLVIDLKKDDIVKKGDYLGKIKREKSKTYTHFLIRNKRNKYLSFNNHVDRIVKAN